MGKRVVLSFKGNTPLNSAQVKLPASKSISNRLLMMRALSGGEVQIQNLSRADDTIILEKALQINEGEIDLKLAGTALRFATAWAALTPGTRILKGLPRLHRRPMKPLVDALKLLGADITYLEKEGFAPLKIIGKKLIGGVLQIDGKMSSQFLSALLLIAPYCEDKVQFILPKNQVSISYVHMTLKLMQQAGAIVHQQNDTLSISGKYRASQFTVEPDWSAASYFYLWSLALHNTLIEINDLHFHSVQGDSVAADIFSHYGIMSHATPTHMRLARKLAPNYPHEINCINCPDLAQSFAVAAVIAQKPLRLTGLQTLQYKETHRINALQNELQKCGVTTRSGSDFLEIISFEKPEQTLVIETYNDHRMAMAFAPLAILYGEVVINDPEVVTKSFPGYWREVEKLGLTIRKE